MGEVKIYRGTKAIVGDRQHILIIDPDVALAYRDVITGERIPASILTDLTELELHPKGEGVWISNEDAEKLLFVASFHLVPFWSQYPDRENESKHILAQLSDRESAGEEQVSLGEVVKVTIELSEEDAFEARFHDEDLASNRIGEQICYQVAEQLRTLNPLTPPVEVEEPKEFGATLEAVSMSMNTRGDIDGKTGKTLVRNLFIGDGNGNWYEQFHLGEAFSWRFSDLISPRVIGGEK